VITTITATVVLMSRIPFHILGLAHLMLCMVLMGCTSTSTRPSLRTAIDELVVDLPADVEWQTLALDPSVLVLMGQQAKAHGQTHTLIVLGLEPRTGDALWTQQVDVPSTQTRRQLWLTADHALLFMADHQSSTLIALGRNDGQQAWRQDRDFKAPRRQIFSATRQTLFAFEWSKQRSDTLSLLALDPSSGETRQTWSLSGYERVLSNTEEGNGWPSQDGRWVMLWLRPLGAKNNALVRIDTTREGDDAREELTRIPQVSMSAVSIWGAAPFFQPQAAIPSDFVMLRVTAPEEPPRLECWSIPEGDVVWSADDRPHRPLIAGGLIDQAAKRSGVLLKQPLLRIEHVGLPTPTHQWTQFLPTPNTLDFAAPMGDDLMIFHVSAAFGQGLDTLEGWFVLARRDGQLIWTSRHGERGLDRTHDAKITRPTLARPLRAGR